MNFVAYQRAFALLLLLAAKTDAIAVGQEKTESSDQFGDVRQLIDTHMAGDPIPSIAVAVAHRGQIVWQEGFGFADLEQRTPATPDTVYRICSVSKVLTATAVMILVERGQVDLDHPINDYLGEAKLKARVGDAKDVTVRRLANHTSGLPQHDQYFYEGEHYQRAPTDAVEVQIARYGNIVWAPGERPQYSNLAFGILDHLVSRESGLRFPEFMRTEVFLPLGMQHSSVGLSDALRPMAAIGYVEGKPLPLVSNASPGAGDLWCSAHDLVRFGMFHLKNRLPDQRAVLSDESLDAMHVTTSKEPGSDFGVGWGTDDNFRGTGYRALGHHGANAGWYSVLLLLPSEDLAIAVLSNGNSNLVDPVVDQILSAVVPEFGRRQAAARETANNSAADASATAFRPPANLRGAWRGSIHTYEGEIPASFWFDETGAFARIGDQDKAVLKQPRFQEGILTADLDSTILTSDTRRQLPGILEIDLTHRGDALNGIIYANSLYGNAAWGGYKLNHWVELKRVR